LKGLLSSPNSIQKAKKWYLDSKGYQLISADL